MDEKRLVAEILCLAKGILRGREAARGMTGYERQMLAAELLRVAMSMAQALKIFDLDPPLETDDIKKRYRQLSLKHHPDHGGDTEMMQLINEANEVLTKGETRSRGRTREEEDERQKRDEQRQEWKRKQEEQKQRYTEVMEKLIKQQKPLVEKAVKRLTKALKAHLGDILQVEGPAKVKITGGDLSRDPSSSTIYAKFQMPIEGGSIQGTVSVNLKAYEPEDVRYFYETSVYLNRKEIRVQRGRFNATNKIAEIANPKFMFPLKRMKAIVKRAQPDDSGTMKKKDFLAALKRELDATISGSAKDIWVYIPLGGDRKLAMYRITFMGTAGWGVNGIYEGHRRTERLKYETFEESAKGLMDIHKYVRGLR